MSDVSLAPATGADALCSTCGRFATVNKFTDLTNVEFRSTRTGLKRDRKNPSDVGATNKPLAAPAGGLPDSFDWREKEGVVTKAKDQGGCGSCWAFSATEALESAAALATGKAAPVLAPQQLVSCSPNPNDCGGTGGCDGSTQELALTYTEAFTYTETEASRSSRTTSTRA